MPWRFTFPSGLVMQGWNWLVLQHQNNVNRVNAWKARWGGQVAGTMPLPTDPDPAERLRADMFLKKKDGVTQRLGTTKCHSCRTSGGPVKIPQLPLYEDRLYCGCRYEEAFLEAYLVRRRWLGPKSLANTPNTLPEDARNMILLLLQDQFGPDFYIHQLLSAQDRLASIQNGVNNGTINDLQV